MATRGWQHVTAADVATLGKQPVQASRRPQKARSKYGAVKTVVDGITFDSKAEARRYQELKLLEKAGEISELQLQPLFVLVVETPQHTKVKIGEYRADFKFWDHGIGQVVEDVKGFSNQLYKWKKRHVQAQYGVRIVEVR